MGILSEPNHIKVFKFKETGLVALCLEVNEYISSREFDRDKVDLNSAKYESDEDGNHYIVFDRIKKS